VTVCLKAILQVCFITNVLWLNTWKSWCCLKKTLLSLFYSVISACKENTCLTNGPHRSTSLKRSGQKKTIVLLESDGDGLNTTFKTLFGNLLFMWLLP